MDFGPQVMRESTSLSADSDRKGKVAPRSSSSLFLCFFFKLLLNFSLPVSFSLISPIAAAQLTHPPTPSRFDFSSTVHPIPLTGSSRRRGRRCPSGHCCGTLRNSASRECVSRTRSPLLLLPLLLPTKPWRRQPSAAGPTGPAAATATASTHCHAERGTHVLQGTWRPTRERVLPHSGQYYEGTDQRHTATSTHTPAWR